jgi:hypothetical protein
MTMKATTERDTLGAMTKTPPIVVRCPKALRDAIEAEVAKTGTTLSEAVLRRLHKSYRIPYVPTKTGRPPRK